LPKAKNDINEHELPLTYSQLMYYIQQTNHKNLWKSAYKTFSGESQSDQKVSSAPTKITESLSSNLVPFELVLREAIIRMYGCPIIHFKLDKMRPESTSEDLNISQFDLETQNVNHYPFLAAIESNTHFYLFYNPVIENSLLDCISYSPAILDKNYNKPMFLVYQLLNFLRSIHQKGLLLGEISANDIYLTENLMLHVIPRIESNLIQYEQPEQEVNENMETGAATPLLVNPQHTLKDYCQMWCTGQISNFDYLTMLNNFAGRRIDSADYHHIVPWVIDFSSKNGNWRDLTKTKYRLTKGDAQLDITYQHNRLCGDSTTPHHVSDVLSEITFYVYMARKTPKSVLCRHVRAKFVAAEYPASIKRLQEWTPDGEKTFV
jgi:WD repeat-containing protein 81